VSRLTKRQNAIQAFDFTLSYLAYDSEIVAMSLNRKLPSVSKTTPGSWAGASVLSREKCTTRKTNALPDVIGASEEKQIRSNGMQSMRHSWLLYQQKINVETDQ
jgi:hypothetical protein